MADNSIETNRSFEHETLPYDIMLCTNTGKRQFCGEDEEIEQIIDEASARVPGLKWLLAGLKGKRNLNGYEYIEAEQAERRLSVQFRPAGAYYGRRAAGFH